MTWRFCWRVIAGITWCDVFAERSFWASCQWREVFAKSQFGASRHWGDVFAERSFGASRQWRDVFAKIQTILPVRTVPSRQSASRPSWPKAGLGLEIANILILLRKISLNWNVVIHFWILTSQFWICCQDHYRYYIWNQKVQYFWFYFYFGHQNCVFCGFFWIAQSEFDDTNFADFASSSFPISAQFFSTQILLYWNLFFCFIKSLQTLPCPNLTNWK